MFGAVGWLAGFGTLFIAGALLFVARRLHRASGKHTKFTKPAGIIGALLAGLAFLASIGGTWMTGWGATAGYLCVAAMLIAAGVLIIDWLLDGSPDSPAFWAAFVLPVLIVLGMAQVPAVAAQVKQGAGQVQQSSMNAGR